MAKLPTLDLVALILVIVGGLNWGLVGLFKFDLVVTLFSSVPMLTQIVYDVVGLAAVYLAFIAPKLNKS
jgi:uncharacterized protein